MSQPAAASSPAPGKAERAATILTRIALALGMVCAISSLASGLGYRLELWRLGTGFKILEYATFGGFGVVALALVGTLIAQAKNLKGARSAGLVGLALGIVVSGPPLYLYYVATHVPEIHDISTDTANPPTFVAVLALRGKKDNSLVPDADTAKKQAEAFPDIRPLIVSVAPAPALGRAEAVARAMGWEIVAVDPQALRVEATARTLLFGFKDDVVIRVAPEGGGSRIDVRSASRIGQSDVGVNARRIRQYLKEFSEAGS